MMLMELKRNLFWFTSSFRTPTFRTKRSITLFSSFTFILITCIMVFLFGNSRIHGSSEWLKSVVLKNRSQFSLYFPYYLFPGNGSNVSAPSEERRDHHGYTSERNIGNLSSDHLSRSSANDHGSRNVTLGGDIINDDNSMVNPWIGSVKNETSDHGINGGNENNTFVLKGSEDSGKSMAKKPKKKSWLEMMSHCDIFDGKWVKDDAAPLYEPGSCPLMDESFNCYRNGRPDYEYLKLRWQPSHCNIPRLDGGKMLKFLKGKRIVYVGDSLNRNMFESMVCLLRNSVKDKSRVFEASGKIEFKKEGAYSFLFPDYNVSVEYIRSAFLVREWEVAADKNGSKKETLRLDLIENSYDACKDADVLVFNTGNWWTHEKTSQGKGYYQEGDHVHEKLDVGEAFDKAMATWARWVESNINPIKTRVFFRAYSFSHFSKGEWNTGGRCDDKEPIKNVQHLVSTDELSPSIPQMLDKSVERVKIPVYYLNVTRMTNYRKDAHPSMYRKPNITAEEKREFTTHQDCSHWCLPGVPDTWNQLMFAQLLFTHKQHRHHQNLHHL